MRQAKKMPDGISLRSRWTGYLRQGAWHVWAGWILCILAVCLFSSYCLWQSGRVPSYTVRQGSTGGWISEPPPDTLETVPQSGEQGNAPEEDGARKDGPERYRLAGCLDGALVLAREGGPQVYTVELNHRVRLTLPDGAPASHQTDWAPLAGSLVEANEVKKEEGLPGSITSGSLRLLSEGFDNRCALYLSVLETLWERDQVLNWGLNGLGVDLSGTSLSVSEQTATAYLFASAHQFWSRTIQGTWQDLADWGYITGAPVAGASGDARVWQWVDGCLFILKEKEWNYNLLPPDPPDGGEWTESVYFDAVKWRTSLRAAFLSDRVSWQGRDGRWGEITAGIS